MRYLYSHDWEMFLDASGDGWTKDLDKARKFRSYHSADQYCEHHSGLDVEIMGEDDAKRVFE